MPFQLESLPQTELSTRLGIVACGLFGITAAAAARAFFACAPGNHEALSALPASAGLRKRRLLMVSLMISNLTRCLALVAVLVLQENTTAVSLESRFPDQLGWVMDFLMLFPAVVFLSAVSVLVLFWAQVHYTTRMEPMPMLDMLFLCMNIGGYLVVIVVASCTFLLHAWKSLDIYMNCIIGFLNLLVAGALFYYGILVWCGLSDLAEKRSPGKKLTKKIWVLSTVCPLVLLARGAWHLVYSIAADSHMQQPLWCVLVIIIVSEWFPAVIMLLTLQPSGSGSSGKPPVVEPMEISTDSESPLLGDDSLAAVGQQRGQNPDHGTWKQIYPPLPN